MRYFLELSYNGTKYCGWQRQPDAPSVQQTIEEALSTILRQSTAVMGCGRTDTGVHAKQYFLHFDCQDALPDNLLFRMNRVLPDDIAIHKLFNVEKEHHTRFDATHRAYEYHIIFEKSPFEKETAWRYNPSKGLDFELLNKAAALLLEYKEFYPFCKSNTDVKTMLCDIRRAEWVITEDRLVFHIAADRFLRGMVRLIVGMCINVAARKLTLESVRHALETQTRLDKPYSVPPQGLFLTDIRYDFISK